VSNLYYIVYKFDFVGLSQPIYGEVYALDTGFGVLELGCIENGTIYEDVHLRANCKTFKQYINQFSGEVLSFTRV
jgi:hypothetical protein